MRSAVVVAFLLMLGSAVLGATVLRDPIAWAATPFQQVIIANDASKPIPVREQNVDAGGDIRVSDASTREATRFEAHWNTTLQQPEVVVPEVPAGKRLVITYVNVSGGSGISGTVLTEGRCSLIRRVTEGNTTTTGTFAALPATLSGASLAVSEEMNLPVEAGETLLFRCSVAPSPQSGFFTMTLVGNYVPV